MIPVIDHRQLLDRLLGEGNGVLRCEPAWVARDFLPPGRRLGLPEDQYDVGERGAICERWLSSISVYEAVRRLPRATGLLLIHAQGDARVPWSVSEELHARASVERKRLLIVPGGHHRSVQHDSELQAESLRFIERAASAR